MIHCKESVHFRILRHEMWNLFSAFEAIFAQYGYECVITCGTDGHTPDDPHYNGFAIDLRSKHLPAGLSHTILLDMREAAGTDYYIFIEAEGTDNEHYHCQIRKDLWRSLL